MEYSFSAAAIIVTVPASSDRNVDLASSGRYVYRKRSMSENKYGEENKDEVKDEEEDEDDNESEKGDMEGDGASG